MITIPFSLFGFTDWILAKNKPAIVVMLATFGMLLGIIVIITLLNVLGLKRYSGYITLALLCSVFISLVIMIPMLLLFRIEDTIKFILVWIVIVGSCLTFSLSNKRYIDMFTEEATNTANTKNQPTSKKPQNNKKNKRKNKK
ncbi:hypothetical protein AB7Z54_02330 [Providencia manganoxydans]|uniref:hypothetical protein n=1 Tax=Providencia manganoxydans TaxID=2923283 RepID=UPI0032DA4CB5